MSHSAKVQWSLRDTLATHNLVKAGPPEELIEVAADVGLISASGLIALLACIWGSKVSSLGL